MKKKKSNQIIQISQIRFRLEEIDHQFLLYNLITLPKIYHNLRKVNLKCCQTIKILIKINKKKQIKLKNISKRFPNYNKINLSLVIKYMNKKL